MVEKKKIIDKRYIPTLIALGLLVILAAISIPLLKYSAESQNKPQADNTFIKFNPAEVNYVLVENPTNPRINCELSLNKAGDWKVNGQDAYNYEVAQVLTILNKVTIVDKIDEYMSLRDFGLLPPSKILTLGFKDETKPKIKVLVGDYTPTTGKRYAKFPATQTVYIVDEYIYSGLTVTPQGLLNKDVFRLPQDNINHIQITRGKKNYLLQKKGDQWYVTLPARVTVPADNDVITGILNNIFGNKSEALLVRNTNNLKKYRLDNPILTILATTPGGKNSEVIISKIIPSTQLHYIMNKANKDVYIIHKTKVDWLDFDDFEIRNKKLILPMLSDIEKINIIQDGKKYDFYRNAENEWASKALASEKIREGDFIEKLVSMYADVTSVLPAKDLREDPGFSKSSLQIEVYEKAGNKKPDYKPYRVTVGKRSKDDFYYVKLTGDPYLFFIREDKLKDIKNMGRITTKKD